MRGKAVIISILAVAVVAFVSAKTTYFVIHKPARTAETEKPMILSETIPTPKDTPSSTEIKASEVSSLNLKTTYKQIFEENSRCRKSYDELFGNNEGVYNSNSACQMTLTFSSDGNATKSIELRRYDRTVKEWRVTEKTEWKSKINEEQFKNLAEIIVNSDAFKNWNDGISIAASNSSISVHHSKDVRTLMSNVDEKTTVFLAMMDAFKQLDARVVWEKVQ